MNRDFGPPDLRQCPSGHEHMPLLRSLPDPVARVAIDMALLTELYASPPPPLRRVKHACKVQRPLALFLWRGSFPRAADPENQSARRLAHPKQIGRAACRERGEISVGAR